MIPPKSYSDWVIVLERFGNGDDTVFEEMNAGFFELDRGTAQRFYTRVDEVYRKRKQSWLDKFQRSFQTQNIKSIDDVEIALNIGKQNLAPLLKFVSSRGLPDEINKTLQKDLIDFVNEIKKSLKINISKTSKEREKLLLMFNTFGLPEILKSDIKQNNLKSNNEIDIISPTRKKIIF